MPYFNAKTIQNLEQKIAASRRRLMDLWDTKGFTDSEVLTASIELDDLLNQYQKIESLKTKS